MQIAKIAGPVTATWYSDPGAPLTRARHPTASVCIPLLASHRNIVFRVHIGRCKTVEIPFVCSPRCSHESRGRFLPGVFLQVQVRPHRALPRTFSSSLPCPDFLSALASLEEAGRRLPARFRCSRVSKLTFGQEQEPRLGHLRFSPRLPNCCLLRASRAHSTSRPPH